VRGRRALARAAHAQLAAQVAGGLALHAEQRVAARPGVEQRPALLPRTGAEVHHVIGGAHQHRLVLHHHQRVPAPGQLFQDRDQLVGVARVEADGGLVQHVERVRERRAERVRQLDALRLAARQRARQAVEREVVQVHALEESKARFELGQHRARDLALARVELEPAQEAQRFGHGLARHRSDVLARDLHAQRLGPSRAPWHDSHGSAVW
jgi:hypothetical protein